MIVWLKSLGIALIIFAFLIGAVSSILITASAYHSGGGSALWIGLGLMGSGLVFIAIGAFLVNRSYKWHDGWPWERRGGS